jgi:peptidyl-prolyl cis-trans isomerase SurA
MPDHHFPIWRCRLFGALLLAAILAPVLLSPAFGQQVVALVNGEPITSFDVEQRGKLIQISSHKTPSRQEILDELVNDKLKLREAKRWGVEITNDEADAQFAGMARRQGLNAEQFTKQIGGLGIAPETLKARIRADTAWNRLVRGRFQSSFQFGEKDILSAMEQRKGDEKDQIGYEYRLRPIVFIVPKGSAPAVVEARRKDAEAFRARFQTCEEAVASARGMKDVAVRNAVTRMSADLAPALRTLLENTPVGRLTAPESTAEGLQLFALCDRKQTTEETPIKRQVREEMFNASFENRTKRYLEELRRSAMIEYR